MYQVDPGEASFVCNRCERRVGYCMGAADDMPGLCDDCFCVIDAAREPPGQTPVAGRVELTIDPAEVIASIKRPR